VRALRQRHRAAIRRRRIAGRLATMANLYGSNFAAPGNALPDPEARADHRLRGATDALGARRNCCCCKVCSQPVRDSPSAAAGWFRRCRAAPSGRFIVQPGTPDTRWCWLFITEVSPIEGCQAWRRDRIDLPLADSRRPFTGR
jgi:hypothetical protein